MRQTYKDSTLKSMKKDELIHLLRLTEYNLETVDEFYRNACDVNKKLANLLDALRIEWGKHDSAGQYDVISVEELTENQWKPRVGDVVYYYMLDGWSFTEFTVCLYDLLLWKTGNCFKTKEEAKTKGKAIMEAIRKEYEEA